MASFLEKLLRAGDKKVLKQLRTYTDAINSLEDSMVELTDADLRAETDKFRARIEDGESLDTLLPEAFAVVREASKRTLGKRHYDVQLMGGAALHLGNIAEMKTGEGKTLVATAPAYLNALSGKGVHVVTVNDYLAEYQANLMGRVYRFLGLESGVILSNQNPELRRQQYLADITYGTNNEFGFDYLRDNMAWALEEQVQRGHNFAIVDEVDSILIDEARTPLIISGPASGEANRWYGEFARMAQSLKVDEDYEVDEKKRTIGVLESGIDKVEDHLGIRNLYESVNTPLIGFLNNSIKAKELFKNNKDYVVVNGEVHIVDEHTGRILPGRRYNEGIHQAIEAKEGVEVKPENQTMATVTLQNYFRMYDKLSGMTGTAETEAAEFMNTYELGVVPIPTNKGVQRTDQSDKVYKNEIAKFRAVVEDIKERNEKGQPILVGTTSVEKSEYLSKLLVKEGVRHEVLNAKNNEREAAIVAQAGRKGAVTVATNMAGRGTDIMLGGNAEFNAVEKMETLGLDPNRTPEEYEQKWPAILEQCEAEVEAEHNEVVELGGLYVLGTERHESRRIDNQLRGRSGRQGDPGESRFYLSLTDDLMRLFNGQAAGRLMAGAPDDTALDSKLVSRVIASAQGQVEARNAEQRKNILKYDDVLNRQREAMYKDRAEILHGADIQEQIQKFIDEVVVSTIVEHTAGHPEDWDLEKLWDVLKPIYPVSITIDDMIEEAGDRTKLTQEMLITELLTDAKYIYEERENKVGSEAMREIERRVLLSVIGRRWPEHLYEMDYLKEGIGLRAMAQRDPLVEYQREGYSMYQSMMEAIREETVGYLYNLDLSKQRTTSSSIKMNLPPQPKFLKYSAPSEDGGTDVRVQENK
ncbi:preprotein translocase subunit SecA [Rothia terrae]|uniref:preprotein translocase subunit SecA n=1 Tax=Rothia terrae TaxID=396015 RepID=UPI001445D41A|nr:preprotein translocase subunit SecA [Rothia terrae]MDT0189129.1 preprotein translocase subunit SecA [Rothia terrae]NKZ33314.1 preprotein translocase subunit SecA [Rothia terrae]